MNNRIEIFNKKQPVAIISLLLLEENINKAPKMSASRRVQYQQTGSPLFITATTMDFEPQQLVTLLKDQWGKKGN